MADVKFSARAYCKILLHTAKYPHCAVNGVLLAESPKNKDQKKTKNIVFVDAVPLFHLCLHVSPMAEVALIQVFIYLENKLRPFCIVSLKYFN